MMKIFVLEGDINNAIYGLRKHLVSQICLNVNEVIIIGGISKDIEVEELSHSLNHKITLVDLRFNTINPILIFYAVLKLIYLVFKHKPNQVLSFNIRPTIIWGFCNRMLNLISTCTITGTITYRDEDSIKDFYKLILNYCLKGYRNIVFQNKFDYFLFDKIGFNVKQNRVIIEGSGVDTDFYKRDNFKPVEFDFVFIGRILKQKGVMEFLSASKRLLLKYPDLKFGLLGPFYQDSKSDSYISSLQLESYIKDGGISYLGVSKDVKSLLCKSKILVLPSYGEGISNVLLEAASMSLPLIASDVPGCREIVLNDYNGYLCKPADIYDLEMKMEKIVNLPDAVVRQMGVNSRNLIIDRFSKKYIVSQYINLLDLV